MYLHVVQVARELNTEKAARARGGHGPTPPTRSDRYALAWALRYGRTHYEFRSTWFAGAHDYAWYPKPFTGRDGPIVTVESYGDDMATISVGSGSWHAHTISEALAFLRFAGVLPADRSVDGEATFGEIAHIKRLEDR